MGSAEELAEFVDSYLAELSRRFGVPKPRWLFVNYEAVRAPMYVWPLDAPPGGGAIFLPEQPLLRAWEADGELCRRALKHILAHEFRHYVQHLRWGRMLDAVPVFVRELGATLFAVRETWMLPGAAARALARLASR